MKILYSFILLLFCCLISKETKAQRYVDLSQNEFIVTSSDDNSAAEKVIDESGLDVDLQGASRFLAHASLGATIEEIKHVSEIGYASWIEEQIEIQHDIDFTSETINIIYFLYEECQSALGLNCLEQFNLNAYMFRYAWWNRIMNGKDLLRQRVALALSETLVISDQSQLVNYPHGLAYFYDILSKNAFGNYRDILMEITLNPAMGVYLTHLNNPKSFPEFNIHPDENYAREIMQLFTIGLYELNNDGSRKLNSEGKWIPTYDNDDIKELAKIFTGLSGGAWADPNNSNSVRFGESFNQYSFVQPMEMYATFHEPGPKVLLGNYTVPANQDGMQDINDAIDVLFNHDNVGPFISKQLIQRLVKSNPSPSYIDRVAGTFNDNGNGVRGDMEAVIKAILLDGEAMECYWFGHVQNGQLKAPIHRYTQLLKGLKATAANDTFWNSGYFYQTYTGQHPLSAPSVFNFYRPDYEPNADFAYYDMVGPEFQILNSSTSSNYVNYWLLTLMREYLVALLNVSPNNPNLPDLNESLYIPYVSNTETYKAYLSDDLLYELIDTPGQLLDYLNILLANGQMEKTTLDKIKSGIDSATFLTLDQKAHFATFLLLIQPDFVIIK